MILSYPVFIGFFLSEKDSRPAESEPYLYQSLPRAYEQKVATQWPSLLSGVLERRSRGLACVSRASRRRRTALFYPRENAFLLLRFLLNICILYVKILVLSADVNFVPTLFINGRIDSDGT